MKRDDPSSEKIEKAYFEFLESADVVGQESYSEQRHCDFVGNEPKVIKQYLTEWGMFIDVLNKKFAAVKSLANEAHGLGL